MDNKTYKEALIKRTYGFSISVIKLIRSISSKDFVTEVISKQLIRSATSIGANIVEAQACSTRKDFSHFINHALKSSNESRYWIALLKDTEPKSKESATLLLKEAQEISKILGSTVKSLKNK